MADTLIHDRGRGPEIVGTRITVYNLLPDFLDPATTEAWLCRVYSLTPEQVAAARAYVLQHADTVLAEHLQIEARIAAGVSAEDRERAVQARETFGHFRQWLADHPPAEEKPSGRLPTFREWLAEQTVIGVCG